MSKMISKLRSILKSKTNDTRHQFIRYFITGVSGTVIDIILFYIALEYFNLHYLIANIFGFVFGLFYTYYLNVIWVFESSKNKNKTKEFFLFFLLSFISLLMGELLLYIAIDILHQNELIAKGIATLILIAWNFTTRKIFLFN